MASVTFLTGLPPRGHGGNGSQGGWRQKAAERRTYREEVWADAMRAMEIHAPFAGAPARVSLVFAIKGGRAAKRYQPRDVPNAVSAWKAGFDALVTAGILVDDSASHMQLGTVTIDPKSGPWVRVTVEALE